MKCDKPPIGWKCTRAANHNGPCSTIEEPKHDTFLRLGIISIEEYNKF